MHAQEPSCNCPLVVGSDVGIPKLSTSGISLPKIGGCIKVKGQFAIDVSFPVGSNQFDGVDFQMDPGALLVVVNIAGLPVSNVGIVNSTLRGCTQMWRGISMRSKPGSNSVSRLDMTNCVVRDAQYAVNPDPGSIVFLYQNNFDKNWTGLNLVTFNGGGISLGLGGNMFQGTGPLLPAFNQQSPLPGSQAAYGINMNLCTDIRIGDNGSNFFKGLKTGIYGQGCLNTVIRQCHFEGIFPPYLFLDGSKGIELFSCRDNQLNFNSFSYIERGIRVIASRGGIQIESNGPFIVTGNAIEVNNFDILPNGYGDPIDMRIEDNLNVLSYVGTCIRATHIHGAGRISLSGNVIQVGSGYNGEQPTYGIEFSNYNSGNGNVSINLNQIEMSAGNKKTGAILTSNNPSKTLVLRNSINSGTHGFTGFGILAANTVKCQMVENTVDGNTYPGGYSIGEAFRVDMSSSSILCCNQPDETTFGVCYLGPNSTNFANTTFKKHANRLYLYNAVTGIQTNTGNDWTFSDPGKQWDALFEGNPQSVIQSRFFVESNLMPDGYDKIEVVGGTQMDRENWFKFEGAAPACFIDVNIPPTPSIFCGFQGYPLQEGIDPKDEWAAGGSATTGMGAMLWEAQRQLYDKLEREPALIGHSSAVSDFKAQADNGAVGAWYAFEQGLADLYTFPSGMENAYSTLLGVCRSKSGDLASIAEQLETTDPSTTGYATLMGQRNLLLNEMDSLFSLLFASDSLLQEEFSSRASALTATNPNLPGSEIYQHNERALNAVLLQVYMQKDWVFDNAQRQVIDDVAAQCPLSGGRAVYLARSLKSLYSQPDWSQDHCMNTEERSSDGQNPKVAQLGVTLFPLPASDLLHVRSERPFGADSRLRVFDLRGQTLRDLRLPEGVGQATVDLSGMPEGIYLLDIRSDSFGHSIQKFSVNRR